MHGQTDHGCNDRGHWTKLHVLMDAKQLEQLRSVGFPAP